MWVKEQAAIKHTRKGSYYRYSCSECGRILDSKTKPNKCLHKIGTEEEIKNRVWKNIVRNALGVKSGRNRLPFDLTERFVFSLFKKQNGLCAISNLPLILGNNASLDRIDSSKGYIKGNVQWVDKYVNLAKGHLSEDFFIQLCRRVANHVSQSSF